ncbi:MAG: hypothetical protein ACI8RZ_005725 [Myxococcota bacterium]
MVGRRDDIRAWRFPPPTPSRLAGEPGEVPWLSLPLAEQQERALLEFGVALTDPGEGSTTRGYVMLREDAAVGPVAIQELLAVAGKEDFTWKTGGRCGGLAEEIALGDDGPLLVYLAPGSEITPERIAAAPAREFDPEERMLELPLPRSQFGVDLLELPLTERLVLPTTHWNQLLWANLLGMPSFLWRGLAGRNFVEIGLRAVSAAVRAGSIKPMRVGAKLGRKGKDCRIHPSAVVEGCWLGDGVEIGANAVVRGCVLSDGSAIEDLAMVEFSVLAPAARVQRQAMLKFSVLRQRATHAGVMQLGVLDRGAAVKSGAWLMDMAFGQQVKLRVGDRLMPAPLGMAGVCVGEDALVGVGVKVAGGRFLPPGLQITADADILVRIPEGLSGRVVVRGGTLESL